MKTQTLFAILMILVFSNCGKDEVDLNSPLGKWKLVDVQGEYKKGSTSAAVEFDVVKISPENLNYTLDVYNKMNFRVRGSYSLKYDFTKTGDASFFRSEVIEKDGIILNGVNTILGDRRLTLSATIIGVKTFVQACENVGAVYRINDEGQLIQANSISGGSFKQVWERE